MCNATSSSAGNSAGIAPRSIKRFTLPQHPMKKFGDLADSYTGITPFFYTVPCMKCMSSSSTLVKWRMLLEIGAEIGDSSQRSAFINQTQQCSLLLKRCISAAIFLYEICLFLSPLSTFIFLTYILKRSVYIIFTYVQCADLLLDLKKN